MICGSVQISVSGLFFEAFFRLSKSQRAGVYGGVADFDSRKKDLRSKVCSDSFPEVDVQLREGQRPVLQGRTPLFCNVFDGQIEQFHERVVAGKS